MKKFRFLFPAAVFLASCGLTDKVGQGPEGTVTPASSDTPATSEVTAEASPPPRPPVAVRPPPTTARTVEQFDTTTQQDRKAAVEEARTASADALLGTTVASLGSAADPGLWMKTPLVSRKTRGRVENPATGDTVALDLVPLDGPASAGSQLSLAAFRLINAPLTSLPELRVYQLGEAG